MKRKLICIAVATAMLVGLGLWIRHFHKRSLPAELPDSNTPEAQAFRFLGFQMYASDDLLDANGTKVGEMLASLDGPDDAPPGGEAEDPRRRFIFELPKTAEPMLFTSQLLIRASGGGIIECGRPELQQADCGDRRLLLCTVDFSSPRTPDDARWRGGDSIEEPIEKVDLILRFYHGRPGPCAVSFPAPFAPGKTVLKKDGRTYSLTVSSRGKRRQSGFSAEADYRLDIDLPVLLYDKLGKRRAAKPSGWGRNDKKTTYRCSLGEMSWDEVTKVVVAEQPQRRTFRDIAISYPNRPRREDAEPKDGGRGMPVGRLADGEPPPPDQLAKALKEMVVARRSQIGEVCNTLLHAKLADLPAERLAAVRKVAASWAAAPAPEIQLWGAKLGMKIGAGDEFLVAALSVVDFGEGWMCGKAAGAISEYYQKPTPQGVHRITRRLLANDDRWVTAYLVAWLAKNDSPETTEALWQLAAADQDRPWLWLTALEALSARKAAEDRASLDRKLRLRLVLAAGPREGEEDLAIEAYRMLPALLRPKCLRVDRKLHDRIYGLLLKHTDRPTATKAIVEFLRRLDPGRDNSSWAVPPIRQLNLWHGMNFGGLGSDLTQDPPDSFVRDCPAVLDEVLRWYERANQEGK